MTSVLVDGIGELVTNCPASGDGLGILDNGALVVEGDRIAWVGLSASAPPADRRVGMMFEQRHRRSIHSGHDANLPRWPPV